MIQADCGVANVELTGVRDLHTMSTEKQVVAHTRLHLANERTLLAWTKLACILASGGFLTQALVPSPCRYEIDAAGRLAKSAATHFFQGAHLLLACVVLALGLRIFFRRRALLDAQWLGSYSAPLSPCVAIIGVLVTLGCTVVHALATEIKYHSADCMRLTDRVAMDLPPPYLYISFHGLPNPLCNLCSGEGAVHRFTLTGAYVGPATDQRAALVHAPRMMVLHKELLILADAGEGAAFHRPALAVFGDCSAFPNLGPRPFLGRITASDLTTEAHFMHPYGLASSRDGAILRVSAQNGGALLNVDLANVSCPITVAAQLEPLPRGHDLEEEPDELDEPEPAQRGPVLRSHDLEEEPDEPDEPELEGESPSGAPSGAPSWAWSTKLGNDGINAASGPLRGVALDDVGCSHVADKHADKIWHVCTGEPLRSTHVPKPLGVHFHSGSSGERLYVGSAGGHGSAVEGMVAPGVYVLERITTPPKESQQSAEPSPSPPPPPPPSPPPPSPPSPPPSVDQSPSLSPPPPSPPAQDDSTEGDVFRIRQLIKHDLLIHPAGLLQHSGVLYVLEQTNRALLTFDAASGNFTGTLLEFLPHVPEGLLLSPGC